MLIGLFGPDTNVTNATFAIAVNLDYENNVTTTLNGPRNLSIFDVTTGTWSATGQSSVFLNLVPGGGVLVGLTSATQLLGDANNDGVVTGTDLVIVQQNFGNVDPNTPTDGLFIGDANDDGQVTGADLTTVQQNFGNVATAAVPEPTSVCLLTLVSLGAMARRRRVAA